MTATRRQRTLRALALFTIGTLVILLASFDPARAAREPALWGMYAAMMVWTIAENMVLRHDEPPSYHGKRGTRLLQMGVMVTIAVSAIDLFHMPAILPRVAAAHALGIAFIAVGGGLRIWAILTLADSFRYELRVEEGQRLMDRGPYAWLRHPSYAAVVLISLGAAFALYSALGVLMGVVLMGFLTHLRIQEEERVLRAAFGPAYDEYSERTWRILPYVY